MQAIFATRLALIAALCVSVASVSYAREKMPKVSHDGLHLTKERGLAAVYIKPGASLEQYDRLAILDCFVSFKKHWQREQREEEHFVSTKQMNDIKKHLAEEFHKVFVKELQDEGGYKVVTTGGEDVLVLRPAIINLDIVAPDSMSTIDERTFSASSGQMTLYLELYDSVTSDILARIIDPESAQGSGMIEWQNEVTNKADADRILKRWAELLRKHLDDAHGGRSSRSR